MKRIALAAAALVGTMGLAQAQESFVTQVGEGNAAANVAGSGGTTTGTQVIQQIGNTNSAVQLQRDGGSSAYTYQTGNGSTALTYQGPGRLANGSAISGGNTAVTVQVGNNFSSQVVQAGRNNTAINWRTNNNNPVPELFSNVTAAQFTPAITVGVPNFNAPGIGRPVQVNPTVAIGSVSVR